jgi:drug/metabolite transporter (DMT)-like permease
MSHSQAISLLIFVNLLWSTAGVVTRHLDSAPSFEVTFWRSTFTALALAIALTLIRGPGFWRRLLYSPKVVWISGICWSIMFTAFMVAMTLTTVANVLIVIAIGPLITALFTRLFLNHKLPAVTWLAIGVTGLGIVWMFFDEGDASLSLIGSVVALAVPLAAAVNFTVMQHVGLNKEVVVSKDKPAQDMLLAVLIGAILSALATLPLSLPFQATVHDLSLLSLLGIFQVAIPCLLVVRLSRELPAPEIMLLAQLEVIFGVTWAWLWAGEQLSINTLTGGVLVVGALMINALTGIFREQRSQKLTA